MEKRVEWSDVYKAASVLDLINNWNNKASASVLSILTYLGVITSIDHTCEHFVRNKGHHIVFVFSHFAINVQPCIHSYCTKF